MTDAEKILWRQLRLRQMKRRRFRRQFSIGQFVVDFACPEKKLIVEIDGGHHSEQVKSDSERTRWLESQGFRVLRFWNNEIFKNRDAVAEVIWNALDSPNTSPHPRLPPQGGKE